MNRQSYPSDLSDQQWQLLEPLLPPPKPGGRPIKYPRREVMNGILYVLRTGCAWRMLPHDLPPWRTTFHYFRTWRRDGTWERIHEVLRDQLRLAEGRAVSPSAAIIDSPSVKMSRAERNQAVWRSKSVPLERRCSAKMSAYDGCRREPLVAARLVESRRQGNRRLSAWWRLACSA